MKRHDHVIASIDHIAECLQALVRINPENDVQAKSNLRAVEARLIAATKHIKEAQTL